MNATMSKIPYPSYKRQCMKFFICIICPLLILISIDLIVQMNTTETEDDERHEQDPQLVKRYVVFYITVLIMSAFSTWVYLVYKKNRYIDTLEEKCFELNDVLSIVKVGVFRPLEADMLVGKYRLFFVVQVNRDKVQYDILYK